MDAQSLSISTVKVRELIGIEWDPVSWNVDVWEDPSEAEDIEPLNSDESSFLVEEGSPTLVEVALPPPVVSAFPTPPEGNNSTLPEETIMSSPEAIADFLHNLPLPKPSLFLDL